jgi:hypothetical protein
MSPATVGANMADVFANTAGCAQPTLAAAPVRQQLASASATPTTLLTDAETAATIDFGPPDAPAMFVFVDPRCPYSLAHWHLLDTGPLTAGAVRVRLILVSVLGNPSTTDAITILSSPDPAAAWRQHVAAAASQSAAGQAAGAPPTSPPPQTRTTAGARALHINDGLAADWGITTVPYTAYQSRDGSPHIAAGLVQSVDELIGDLPPSPTPYSTTP